MQKTQMVYRFMSEQEFNSWLNGDKSSISHEYVADNGASSNNHQYVDGTKYVHFFKNLTDAPVILEIMPLDVTHLCRFELPAELIDGRQGSGVYYDEERGRVEIAEYAIELKKIDALSLKDYLVVNDVAMARFLDDDKFIAIDREKDIVM